jgi:hypothetical protein
MTKITIPGMKRGFDLKPKVKGCFENADDLKGG